MYRITPTSDASNDFILYLLGNIAQPMIYMLLSVLPNEMTKRQTVILTCCNHRSRLPLKSYANPNYHPISPILDLG